MTSPESFASGPDEAPGGYAGRVTRAGAWKLSGSILGYFVVFARTAVLARLLTPVHFGAFNLVLVVIVFADGFTRLGLETALIYRREVDRGALELVWTLNVIRGFAMAGLLWLCAPLLGAAFDQSELAVLLRWSCLAPAISSLRSAGSPLLMRELRFRPLVVGGLITEVLVVAGTIIFAIYAPGPEAILGGYVLGAFLRVALSYIIAPFRPRFRWDWPRAKELLKFGRTMVWLSLLVVFMNYADNAIIGGLLGSFRLGLYSMAFNVMTLLMDRLASPLVEVVFPAFCRLKETPERMETALVRVFSLLAGMILPVMAGLALLSREAVVLYLGAAWLPVGPILTVFCFAGGFRALARLLSNWLVANGKPRLLLKVRLLEIPLYLAGVVFLTIHAGIIGTAAAVAGMAALELVIMLALVARMRPGVMRPILLVLCRAATSAAVMAGAVWWLRVALADTGTLVRASICVPAGVVVYMGAAALFNRGLYREILSAWRALRRRSGEQLEGGAADSPGEEE